MSTARSGKDPLLIGSIKPNVGHLEGCAGLAGVIKSILSMEKGMIPAVAEFETLNPRLKLDAWGLSIPTQLTPWPPGLRRVSVNSFGYGGTNAHAILDDAYHYLQEHNLRGNHITLPCVSGEADESSAEVKPPIPASIHHRLFCFSTPNQGGAARLAESYKHFLESKLEDGKCLTNESEFLRNLAHTLNERRTVFDWRSYVVADSTASLLEKVKNGFPKLPRALKTPSCAFVFTGQGAQWYAMGRELQTQPIFRASLKAADLYLTGLGSQWSVLKELNSSEAQSRVSEPEVSQSLCTIVQVALVDLLQYWGVRPKAVVGHSSGEIGKPRLTITESHTFVKFANSYSYSCSLCCRFSVARRCVEGRLLPWDILCFYQNLLPSSPGYHERCSIVRS
jgi:acyl transferase domain-containing protein